MTSWEEIMVQRMGSLWEEISLRGKSSLVARSGAALADNGEDLALHYWGRMVRIGWPDLSAAWMDDGGTLSTYDTAMLVYYLHTADGAPESGKWVNFRELPDGMFYHQAFQGYSGNRLAAHFGNDAGAYAQAAEALNGKKLEEFGALAYTFKPLPRFRLAAIFWPGDDDFPARAQILFDAGACHYLTIDGCAMIGSGLVGRLIKAARG